jgi:hypothetical protein
VRACTACFDLCATGLMLRNTLTLLFFLVMTLAKDAPRRNRVSCSCDFAAVLGAASIQVIFRAFESFKSVGGVWPHPRQAIL